MWRNSSRFIILIFFLVFPRNILSFSFNNEFFWSLSVKTYVSLLISLLLKFVSDDCFVASKCITISFRSFHKTNVFCSLVLILYMDQYGENWIYFLYIFSSSFPPSGLVRVTRGSWSRPRKPTKRFRRSGSDLILNIPANLQWICSTSSLSSSSTRNTSVGSMSKKCISVVI